MTLWQDRRFHRVSTRNELSQPGEIGRYGRMKIKSRAIILSAVFSICLSFVVVANSSGEEYESLDGLKSIKTVFDVRLSSPKNAVSHLKLIHETFKDKNIRAVESDPTFVVIFMGPSVKLISKQREGFSSEEHTVLDEIARTISEMSKDGIEFELCLIAARVFGVDPTSVLPEFQHVGNGWISMIGYQANGYSLVPAY
jgi:intracellular sulfur oxidation DsrE/DsrF family protein